MALKVAIIGDTGTGKSTSYRNMDKTSSYIIHADSKSLPFSESGFKIQHRSDIEWINNKLNELNQPTGNPARIKSIMLDTVNGIMLDDEMAKMKIGSYDKWVDLAQSVYQLCRSGHLLRKDQIVYYFFHEESWLDDDGVRNTRIKTSGKKLNKITLETKFTIILRSIKTGSGRNTQYGFEIYPNQGAPTKIPLGLVFPNMVENGDSIWIPNDLAIIDTALRKYYEMPSEPTPIVSPGTIIFSTESSNKDKK